MSKSLALALAPYSIRVNSICPGPVETPFAQQAFAQGGAVVGRGVITDWKQALQALISEVPIGRRGHPEEIASAALFLASDEASFITGVTLPVDGGYTAH